MTRLILTALVLCPAAASACESMAAMSGGSACATKQGCGAMSILLMAVVAALGVWVLRSVEKDSVAVKRTGQVVGWTLAVVGLFGFLCGAASYGAKKSKSCTMKHEMSSAPVSSEETKLPPGHPPIGPAKK